MGLISKYFRDNELECKCGCRTLNIDPYFLKKLDKAREAYGMPMVITSGCRCPQHNISVGGSPNSSHLTGQAVDIACNDSRSRYNMIKALMSVGFNRIGISNTFIHVDNDESKASFVMWIY